MWACACSRFRTFCGVVAHQFRVGMSQVPKAEGMNMYMYIYIYVYVCVCIFVSK